MLRAIAADGDRSALSELVQMLAKNVAWLEGYSYREKGNLKKLAGLLGAWPVMFNSRPRKQQQVADYLARIGLAPKEINRALGWDQLVSTVEVKDPEPPRFNNPEEKGRAILQTSYLAGRLMEELQHHVADGNLLATVKFVMLLGSKRDLAGKLLRPRQRQPQSHRQLCTSLASDDGVLLAANQSRRRISETNRAGHEGANFFVLQVGKFLA